MQDRHAGSEFDSLLSGHPKMRIVIAGILAFMAAMLIRAPFYPMPEHSNPPPGWLLVALGVAVLLFAIALVLPWRWAQLAFATGFVLAAGMVLWIPFSPGELKSVAQLFTPFGFFAWTLGDRPTRVTAAIIAVFVMGALSILVATVLQETFGPRRWLEGLLGVGVLLIVPFVFGLIAIVVVLLSPVVIWRLIEQRWSRGATDVQ